MNELKKIIAKVNFQLYAVAILMCLMAAGSAYFFIHLLTKSLFFAGIGGFLSFAGTAFWVNLFKNKKKEAIHLIHQKLEDTEYSLELLNIEQPNLAQQLQLERLFSKVKFKTPWVFDFKLIYFLLIFIISLLSFFYFPKFNFLQKNTLKKQGISTNSIEKTVQIPTFISSELSITPPAYTGLSSTNSENMNASAISGSILKWRLSFSNHQDLTVKLSNNQGEEIILSKKLDKFEYADQLVSSGFYAFKAFWHDSLVYQSDYYRLEAIPDLTPKIEPSSKELYKLHYLKDQKNVQISAKISDDFSVNQAFIVATLARGSGENVKFREVKFPIVEKNFKEANITKNIDLKSLNFAPGDELYYYWAAFDNKRPIPNYTKSDTYFIVYKDTSQTEEADLATMAMNIMPEYFRSQRQIIIDTEKLIAKRKKLSKEVFNSTSNEIGFDQKALRLRYGQYLGEEEESSIGGVNALPSDVKTDGDMLKGFRHDHDEGEGDHEDGEKHNEHEHSHETEKLNESDPVASLLADYVHSHDDGEVNTFYEQSTRSLLKMALEQMWQSELHLRLYEPEKAIPFEKKALEYLKSAQQKARTFVKKTSFDPPPIKEKEKRLTGELTKFNTAFKYEKTYSQQQIEQLIAEVMGIISAKSIDKKLDKVQRQKVLELSSVLGNKIVNSSLSNWSILSNLQQIINDKDLSKNEQLLLKTKLYQLINKTLPNKNNPRNASYMSEKKLEKAFWKNF
ncbi:hypothetical protein EMA8858_01641 [Emticicia aquatica]|uniref:DUF4175 domain-containing protein n=1 Tax=Emticicia aquatica TaxID=1681835 RepID=A0ABM9ANW1_9BACT|nr:DUF4175 family protein [Emticicia aquatica]CAH0995518.1 hypothetical protein EMA8858_01641 [Emticicia aquatica]